MTYKKKLIEVALPLDAINREAAREKSIRHGHPSTLHLWWARRPLAAARAVIWASLVDDPSAHPDRFPTEEDQERERKRLFDILEELVKWENSTNERLLDAAREEILKSTDGDPPPILDPFCGGGTIPLEAQRLGLKAIGGDLNPVAVLISKAMVEIPPRFAGLPPVNPEARAESGLKTWQRAQGLAEDIRYYGQWMQDEAWERIGHLYPTVELPPEKGGGGATVIAWIWARTVKSPNPAWDGHVPLVRSWVLSKKRGKPTVWIEPQVDHAAGSISYRIRQDGTPVDGTVGRSSGGRCIATGTPFDFPYIRDHGKARGFGRHLMAAVVEGPAGREYLLPSAQPEPDSTPKTPDVPLPDNRRDFKPPGYGMKTFADLFTDRQLVALDAFSDLVTDVREVVERGAKDAGLDSDGHRLRDGGSGAAAYADAVATYLAFVADKCADYWSTICTWHNSKELIRNTFARQAIPMTWDFAEVNPFSDSTGSWLGMLEWTAKVVEQLPATIPGLISQRDAAAWIAENTGTVLSTDPPYYDNISYADLSDYFYVWLRRNLRDVWPDELSTLLTPKVEELIANPYRQGSKDAAFEHFESGMEAVFEKVAEHHDGRFPLTVFYAFKQAEIVAEGQVSTGWETFLDGLLASGLGIHATWPVRTELANRPLASGTAALASSIVLVCRPRDVDAPMATRSEFLNALRAELPDAVRLLQAESILPVDLAQSAIGPGMSVFSRFSKVVEADGRPMSVRQALALINEVLQEVLSEEETEFDADTRWALTWYEENGFSAGQYGRAETLSKAKDTSITGVVNAGVATSRDGKVKLVGPDELSDDWDPTVDERATVWELTHHLIRRLESSESHASELLRRVGGGYGDRARQLAYLLFDIAERKGRAKEAVAYNSLIQAWPDLTRLAASDSGPVQQTLGE